ENVDVERIDLTGRAAKADEVAHGPQAIERSWKRRLADAVINNIAELAAGDLFHLRYKILVAIKDGVVATVLLCEFGLLFGADSADDGRAEMIGPLAGDQADATGGRVNEADGALLDLVGLVDQVLHRHALEHHAGRLLVRDFGRQFARGICGTQPLRCVSAERPDKGHAVANLDVSNAGPHRRDFAGALIAGDERK